MGDARVSYLERVRRRNFDRRSGLADSNLGARRRAGAKLKNSYIEKYLEKAFSFNHLLVRAPSALTH